MPLKIGNLVILGHRPSFWKRSFPNEKDRFIKGQLDEGRDLVPLRYQAPTRQPLVEIRRATPHLALPSASKVKAALKAIPATATHAQLMTQVLGHVRTHRMLNPRTPLVVIIGEQHSLNATQSMAMSAMHAVADMRYKQFICEQPPDEMQDPGAQHALAGHARRLGRAINNGTAFDTREPDDDEMNIMTNYLAYAAHRGFDVKGHDELKETAPDADQREAAMMTNINNELLLCDVTVVMAGSVHVPYLHERLSATHNTVAISLVSPPEPGDQEDVRRLSYMLSHPSILNIRPSDRPADEINAARLDGSAFAAALQSAR